MTYLVKSISLMATEHNFLTRWEG